DPDQRVFPGGAAAGLVVVAQRSRRAARGRPRQDAARGSRLAAGARRRRWQRPDPAGTGAGARRPHATAEAVAAIMKGIRLALLLGAFLVGGARAQSRGGVIDRIVAVVGTRPILMSEVEEQVAQLQSQGQQIPSDSAGLAKLRRRIL